MVYNWATVIKISFIEHQICPIHSILPDRTQLIWAFARTGWYYNNGTKTTFGHVLSEKNRFLLVMGRFLIL